MRRYAVLALIAIAAAGCGGGGGGAGGAASGGPIVGAAAKTARAGSLKADFTIAGAGIQGTGSGVFDNDSQGTGRLTMHVSVQGQTVTVESVIVGPVLYMRSPVFLRAGLPAGKEWVRLDLAQLARQQGVDLGSLVNSNPSPTGALAYLRGSTGVHKVGTEQVGGVETTHYKATIDLERAAQKASGSTRASIRSVITAGGVKTIPIDVWVDGDGYVRKVIYTQHSGRRQSARITMELHDFGGHVPIASPPADSVIDFTQILRQPRSG